MNYFLYSENLLDYIRLTNTKYKKPIEKFGKKVYAFNSSEVYCNKIKGFRPFNKIEIDESLDLSVEFEDRYLKWTQDYLTIQCTSLSNLLTQIGLTQNIVYKYPMLLDGIWLIFYNNKNNIQYLIKNGLLKDLTELFELIKEYDKSESIKAKLVIKDKIHIICYAFIKKHLSLVNNDEGIDLNYVRAVEAYLITKPFLKNNLITLVEINKTNYNVVKTEVVKYNNTYNEEYYNSLLNTNKDEDVLTKKKLTKIREDIVFEMLSKNINATTKEINEKLGKYKYKSLTLIYSLYNRCKTKMLENGDLK